MLELLYTAKCKDGCILNMYYLINNNILIVIQSNIDVFSA